MRARMVAEGAGVEPNQGYAGPSHRGLEPCAGADRRRPLRFLPSSFAALAAWVIGPKLSHKKTPHGTSFLVRRPMRR